MQQFTMIYNLRKKIIEKNRRCKKKKKKELKKGGKGKIKK
jgi:hypothetical protein